MKNETLSLLVALALLSPVAADAQSPHCDLPVSAYLTDSGGAPLDGVLDLELRFYVEEDAALPGECRSFVRADVEEGWLRLTVDACAVPEPADCGIAPIRSLIGDGPGQLFVGIVITPDGSELEPRISVGSVPYALSAFDSQRLAGEGPDAFEDAGTASDLVATHAADTDAHHPADSSGIDIRPASATVGDVVIEETLIDFGPDATDELNASIVQTLTGGGAADALHTHAAGSVTGGSCYMMFGATTCGEGFTAMFDGVAAQPYLYESNGTGAAGTLCIASSAVSSFASGIAGMDGMGIASVREGEERIVLVGDRLLCTICCQ
jgi:hypothetical protein